jgi:sulfate adenylyltransferase
MQKGFCVWLTGLPCSGKTTIALELISILRGRGRKVTLLDGDVVRPWLSKELGFSKSDRAANITRVGHIAELLTSHGAAVICSLVSPYRKAREEVRSMIGRDFVEVWVSTEANICESRDVKGMWKEARNGRRPNFTGLDDPYEPPVGPEITIDTVRETPLQSAERIWGYLSSCGYLDVPAERRQHGPVAAL